VVPLLTRGIHFAISTTPPEQEKPVHKGVKGVGAISLSDVPMTVSDLLDPFFFILKNKILPTFVWYVLPKLRKTIFLLVFFNKMGLREVNFLHTHPLKWM
jgi:hypothetical protein